MKLELLLIAFLVVSTYGMQSLAEDDGGLGLGAEMVEKGIRQTGIGLADDVYGLNPNGSGGSDSIILMASYTPDPYAIPAVNEMNLMATDLFYVLFFIILFGHAAVLILAKRNPNKLEALKLGTLDMNGFHYDEFVKKMISGIFIVGLTHFGLKEILEFGQAITRAFMQSVSGNIEPSPDNVVLYTAMAALWFCELIFFIIRDYVIVMVVGFAMIVGAMYVWTKTEEMAKTIFNYFLLMVFMQPVVVGITCLGIRAITESSELMMNHNIKQYLISGSEILYYLGLLCFIFIVSLLFVLYPILKLILRVAVSKSIWKAM
ncbi:MAG: hypothetical protein E4G94_00910 [ANME-2 cluster archaeon]|nr:MAG: hypothetical protein E4G94_00910 [ANME-2 cluster archaeon]